MMCIKYSEIYYVCAESKAQNTPFIHTYTSLTFGSYKQTDLNSFLLPFSLSSSFYQPIYLSSLLPYLA